MSRMATTAPACRVPQWSPTHVPGQTRTTWPKIPQAPSSATRNSTGSDHKRLSWHRIRAVVAAGADVRMSGERVLGVDACKTGIVLSGDATTAHAMATVEQLVGAARLDGQVDVVAIDMPIGLPDAGTHAADLLARAVVGRPRPSVFITPVRAAPDSPDHASAGHRGPRGHENQPAA